MNVEAPARSGQRTHGDTQRFLEDLLDEAQLTDREYHHLNLSVPLTASIVNSVTRTGSEPRRVLLIGGSTLLSEALLRLGVDLEIWRLPRSILSSGADARVTREVTAESLSAAELGERAYGLILLPFVLESMPEHVGEFLRRARRSLMPGGRIVIATRNQARLESRVAAMLGRPAPQRRPPGSLSLSWPAQATYREYHRQEIRDLCREAGLKVDRFDYVDASRLFLELEPMTIESYVLKKVAQVARRGAESMRDCMLLELSSRPGDDGPLPPVPYVSVAVSARRGGQPFRDTLAALEHQTYAADRYEVTVLHDGRSQEVSDIIAEARQRGALRLQEVVDAQPEGAGIRNQALREARADIVGQTDDSSIPPSDWIEAAVIRFDSDTAAISGPVFAGPGSHPKYFEVPGTRPDPAERERWRTDLFPIVNVFYRTSAARAVGGFDERVARAESAFGWDTDLAWRLHRAGWQVRFCETLAISVVFRPARAMSPFAQVKYAEDLVRAYAEIPEVAPQLFAGVFASRQTMYFDIMLAGATLAVRRRNRLWLLCAVPWLSQVSKRFGIWPPRSWVPSAAVIARLGGLHLLWLAGFIRGAIRTRKVVL